MKDSNGGTPSGAHGKKSSSQRLIGEAEIKELLLKQKLVIKI
jgi:hypothetical protein